MGGASGMITQLIMIGVVLYIGVNFVLPLAQKGIHGATGLIGDVTNTAGSISSRFTGAAYSDDYGQDF